jgi:NAD+ synthase (glutamine-hydrolysing)
MKIALAQIRTLPGKIEENTGKIISFIEKARNLGANLVIFPELSIPGYAVMDLAYSSSYLEENKKALDKIISVSNDIAVIAGFIDFDNGKRSGNRPLLYNSAAIIENKKLIGIQDKTLLPNYDIFFEDRYFSPARDIKIHEISGKKFGVQICEDLWDEDYPVKIADDLVKKKADIIVNISASPFNCGKLLERQNIISALVKKYKIPFIYTNLIGGFDGFEGETIFDGRSLAYDENGKVIAAGPAFEEDLILFDLPSSKPVIIHNELPEKEIYQALVMGISDFFMRLGFKKAFIGLSGGIDSAVVTALAADALGIENVTAITMPSHITSAETLEDSRIVAKNLGINLIERSIIPEYEAWKMSFKAANSREPSSLTRQNKQARIRGAILMEYSNENSQGLVISTGNKTELALGYCTLYGDMCGAIAAISDVSKDKVYALAKFINSERGSNVIPNSIIERVPSAELEINQTDRANLPADYPVIAPLVESIIEEAPSDEALYRSFPKDIVDKTIKLINQNEFKRRQAPPGIRITKRAFGIGRRVPMGL